MEYFSNAFSTLAEKSLEENEKFSKACTEFAKIYKPTETNFESLANQFLKTTELSKAIPESRKTSAKRGGESPEMETLRNNFSDLKKEVTKTLQEYQNLFRGLSLEELWKQSADSVVYTDKLVEILDNFDKKYSAAKKQRGGVDFNDLEHFALKILRDPNIIAEIRSNYKYLFVDEYQDTSPIQEEIIKALSCENLFMVGDVKQSIYGFRGCEPSIFVDKYDSYNKLNSTALNSDDSLGDAICLNTNFRTNSEIFTFVNGLFSQIMTADFGKVNYKDDACLTGPNKRSLVSHPSVKVDVVVKRKKENVKSQGIYDITKIDDDVDDLSVGNVIAQNIRSYLGSAYKDKDGSSKRIEYGDIVILMRSMTDRATKVYNCLLENNIPVVANFKIDGFSSKEIRDIINLLRVVDNPYNEIYLVGACLSFGKFSENELGEIRIATPDFTNFYDRLKMYQTEGPLLDKINAFLSLIEKIRLYSLSATVCQTVLYLLSLTEYNLYVLGLPNGSLRVRKLYNFIDTLQNAPYAKTINKFLQFLDDSEENAVDQAVGQTNAVRLMTMHASKGLEFPIVIIAGIETQFNTKAPYPSQNVNMGIAVNYYDFDNMKEIKTLGNAACGLSYKTKLKEEEMRLLYVALTRAKFVLNIVGSALPNDLTSISKLPSKATSHTDWIFKYLKSRLGSIKNYSSNDLEVNVVQELEKQESENLPLLLNQSKDKKSAIEKLSYVYPYKSQSDMPIKVVSSSLDKLLLKLTSTNDDDDVDNTQSLAPLDITDDETAIVEQMSLCDGTPMYDCVVTDTQKDSLSIKDETIIAPTKNNKDKQLVSLSSIGTAYHKILQTCSFGTTAEDVTKQIDALVQNTSIEQDVAKRLSADVVANVLNNKDLQHLLEGCTIYKELPFMLSVPFNKLIPQSSFTDEIILQGVIDLLAVKDNKAIVVDYKFTTHIDLVKQNYSKQLDSYRIAVNQILGISDIECYILSISDNKLIKID